MPCQEQLLLSFSTLQSLGTETAVLGHSCLPNEEKGWFTLYWKGFHLNSGGQTRCRHEEMS